MYFVQSGHYKFDTTPKKLFRKIVLLFYNVLCFQVNHMSFGEVQTVDLIPDGSNVRVTKQSAHDYVQAYMRYTYHDSVKNQFEAFQRGFMKVCNGRVIVSVCVCVCERESTVVSRMYNVPHFKGSM